MRAGYSLVPCAEPRYLTIRSRRVAIWSLTRWSRKITQSLTYSSRPWRVSVLLALLAGDDGGDALVLEPAEEPAQLGAQDGLVGQAGEERLEGVEHDALGADGVDGVAEADEQAFQVVFAGLLDLAALDADVVHRQLSCGGSARPGRSRARRRSRPAPRRSPRRP